jgi:hypothetical protein|tara:strand:- start:1230 stop:1547 length:318 start_codon:yes stop_codon:yes gene_type:complete
MESNEFYSTLASLPSTYRFDVEGKAIKGRLTRGAARGATLNPVTAVAYRTTGQVYGTNKRETLKAGTAVGLTREFATHVYNATTGVSNRGNSQVVRGKIRSALEI